MVKSVDHDDNYCNSSFSQNRELLYLSTIYLFIDITNWKKT